MFSRESFQRQMCAVMEVLVEAAVAEMRRLLVLNKASRCSSCSALLSTSSMCGKSREGEKDVTLLEGTQEMTVVESQFASLMETLTKGAVEKLTWLLKVSMSGDEGTMDGANNNNNREGPDVAREDDDNADSQPRHFVFVIPVWPDGEKQEDAAASLAPTEKEELQATQPVSELNDEDVADLDTDLTCTTQELTANADKSKKKKKKKKKKEPTQKEPIKKEPIKCPHQGCERTFALKGLFDRHFLYHSKPHSCSQCDKSFARPEGLAAHSRKHTGEKLFRCSECGTGFAYRSTFNRHMHQHQCKKTQLGSQTCTFCEAVFPGKFEFQRHKCSALEKTFRCSLCAKTFECRQSLADHENLHTGERDYVCEMCGERFFSSSSLSTHRVTHLQQDHLSKQTERKLCTCDVCGKVCSHRSALKQHMLTHTGEKPYVCETCGKKCAHASALQNHLRIHTGQKPGQRPVCDVCGKTLKNMTTLKYHMRVHTGDKPYSCDVCGKRFSHPQNLNTHRRTHTGEKLYGCNICGRRFTAANGLKGHSFLHSGEWPYHCLTCGRNFYQPGEFKKHQKVHLPPQTSKVTITEVPL